MENQAYHDPVLLHEAVDGLEVRPGGTYVDVTFGGGGHSRHILSKLDENGRLIVFDQDPDAMQNQPESLKQDPRLVFVASNFKNLHRFLRLHKALPVDGILADLGVSSHQIDTDSRGFSTRFEGALDMRMNQQGEFTAADVLNNWSEAELVRIFSEYGELRGARSLARKIVQFRKEQPIETTAQLKELAKPPSRSIKINRYHAQVFQALRIAVNDEIGVLRSFLEQTTECIAPGGRLSVISYHSLEDRPVKQFILNGQFSKEVKKDFYGHVIRPFDPLNRKPILPSEKEILKNPRARSARLRIAVRRQSSSS